MIQDAPAALSSAAGPPYRAKLVEKGVIQSSKGSTMSAFVTPALLRLVSNSARDKDKSDANLLPESSIKRATKLIVFAESRLRPQMLYPSDVAVGTP